MLSNKTTAMSELLAKHPRPWKLTEVAPKYAHVRDANSTIVAYQVDLLIATVLVSAVNAAGERPESPTRPFVDAFADAMESKLEKNRHKGDREGWLKDTPQSLLIRLAMECDELRVAVDQELPPSAVLSEAADVANFAMMIADSYQHRSPLPAAGDNKNTEVYGRNYCPTCGHEAVENHICKNTPV